jgi:prepilin signal peptidase PulO-like enzyme (type II secretory pathway)
MELFWTIFAFYLGSLFASFSQLVAGRMIQGKSIGGTSLCPECHTHLRLLDVFPLFGYALNRGKCHFCHSRISPLYLLIELAGGGLFAVEYLVFGWSVEFAVAAIAVVVLLCESITDIQTRLIYDRVWLIGLGLIVVLRTIDGSFLAHLFSAALLFATMFFLMKLGEWVFRKEALGGGDVKLGLFLGFVLTWEKGLLALFLASLLGFLFGVLRKRRELEMPFVPFLFAGVLIAQWVGTIMIQWYLGLLGV